MNSIEEPKHTICIQCNKRVISYPNKLCRRQFLFPSQYQTNQFNTISDQMNIINKFSIDSKTSGNSKLDEFIKETQLNSKCCDDFIEWIPYSNLKNIKYLTNGGNSKVYFGTWLLNKSLASNKLINVVLKVIKGDFGDILNEFKMHHKCRSQNVIPFYGITKVPEGDEYAMVTRYAEYGDLRNYIRRYFSNLNWTGKANILIKLSKALNSLHQMDLLHRDFHCKNILVDEDQRIYINDFELCQSIIDSEKVPNIIQGVLPYMAPEVLRCKPYTRQSEVYSISMIMWELTSKNPPFLTWYHDVELALAILDGLRPKIIEGTPEFYADIMKQCWDFDPLQRPDASLLPQIFEGMKELCRMFDDNLYSPKLELQPDFIKNSNENSTESVYVTEAYKYSLDKLSFSTELQDNEIEEKKITKEFSIELTNQLKYYELQLRSSSNSFDINSSSTIEDRIIKKFDDNRSRKTKHKKLFEDDDKRAQKLRKYQKTEKINKKKNRRSQISEVDDEIASQISESEDSRYATQTYDFSLDEIPN